MGEVVESDETLMGRYRDGDAAAFETLYRRYRKPVYRYLRAQVGRTADADELFQDTWLNLVRARRGYEPRAAFRTFLYRIAHHRLVDHYRSGGRARTVLFEAGSVDEVVAVASGAPDPGREIDAQRRLTRFRAAVAALPAEQRDAFLLHEEGGLDLAAIAEATGVGRETVKSRLRYAWSKLRPLAAEE